MHPGLDQLPQHIPASRETGTEVCCATAITCRPAHAADAIPSRPAAVRTTASSVSLNDT
ncbi:hypothetical protein ACWDYJ_34195 [Streptomyces sp. NPDC003042]